MHNIAAERFVVINMDHVEDQYVGVCLLESAVVLSM